MLSAGEGCYRPGLHETPVYPPLPLSPHLSLCTICVLTCDRCDRYTNVPPYCVLVKDPTDQCCMKPLCTPPVTQSPHPQNTQSPPGISTLKPPQQGTVSPPLNPQPTQNPPLPTSLLPTPAPREYTHIPSTEFCVAPAMLRPNSAEGRLHHLGGYSKHGIIGYTAPAGAAGFFSLSRVNFLC